MSRKVLFGGIAAGVVVFFWGALSHMALPIGEAGISELSNEAQVVDALKANVSAPGLYFFPGFGGNRASEAAQKQWEEKIRQGPFGILVYQPAGQNPMEPAQLGTEFVSNIASGLLVSLLLAWAAPSLGSYGAKVCFVALIGLVPGLDVDVSYWNWYHFPGTYTVAQIADHAIGWLLAGLALAKIHR